VVTANNAKPRIQPISAAIKKIGKKLRGTRFGGFIARVVDNMGNDAAVDLAAAVSYYVILSLFPLLLGIVAILGFFLPYTAIEDAIARFLQQNFSGLEQILRPNIASIVHVRGPLAVIGIMGFFWSGSAMFSAISLAVNRAWEVDHPRKIALRKLREMAMSLSTTLLLVLSMAGTALFALVIPRSPLIQKAANSLISIILVFGVFTVIYKWVPNTRTYWRFVWPGALLGAVIFEMARILMGLFFTTFTRFELTYSTIASIVVLLIWVYLSALILVVGAEISFEYSRMRLKLPLKRWKLVLDKA
jgi:membrane protein